jgi:hypothetical protein
MARCVTDWVAPGKGATVSEVAALCGKTVQDDRRTSLAIVRPGDVMDYDCQRAEVVLARLDGEFKPEPLPHDQQIEKARMIAAQVDRGSFKHDRGVDAYGRPTIGVYAGPNRICTVHQTGDGTGLRVQRDPNEQATCERFGVTYTD